MDHLLLGDLYIINIYSNGNLTSLERIRWLMIIRAIIIVIVRKWIIMKDEILLLISWKYSSQEIKFHDGGEKMFCRCLHHRSKD